MGQQLRILMPSACLLFWAVVAVQSVAAQSGRYPPADEAWDGTSYRAVLQRAETEGLALPKLSNAATKAVFERMVNADNIPLRLGLNRTLAVTIRFQKLDSALDPIHKLVALYSNEIQKGQPCATELTRLMVYEAKVSAALLDLAEPYLATLAKDKRYQIHVAYLDRVKSDARQLYSKLVRSMTETRLYAKSDTLEMIAGALDGLAAYHPIFTSQDRRDLVQTLTQQISATTDEEIRKALTELREAIEHRQVRT